jgi:5-methylcytosine-specific restriction endonuclease McrA
VNRPVPGRHRSRGAGPHHVLQLDVNGTPQDWISLEDAATHVATDEVVWFDGDGPLATLRGGTNARTGRPSRVEVYPIIALRGASRVNLFERAPALNREKVLRRDRCTCAYCGQTFRAIDLTMEHIVPGSRGGAWSWMNLVAACRTCNEKKADRTPDEAGMPLVYLPYVPSRWEDFLLHGREVRADVHAWLKARLPKGSRLNG